MFLQAQLTSGVALGAEVAGGRSPDAPTKFEVTGTEGTLTVLGGAMRGVQSGRLRWLLNGQEQPLAEGPVSSMPDAAVNVAGIYAMLRDDILNSSANAPDFNHAVALHHLVDAVFSSSERGARLSASGWPKK